MGGPDAVLLLFPPAAGGGGVLSEWRGAEGSILGWTQGPAPTESILADNTRAVFRGQS